MSKTTGKPWGSENLLFQGHGYAVKKISLLPDQKTSLHFHNIKHETVMVLSGSLKVFVHKPDEDPVNVTLAPGDYLEIEPKTIHQMSSPDVETIYFEAQTDHLDDVVRLEDKYGRL